MGGSSLYDNDVYAWAEQQAAVLRGLAARRDLPNELDLANVIEGIEDVGQGRAQYRKDPARQYPRPTRACRQLAGFGRRAPPARYVAGQVSRNCHTQPSTVAG